MNLGIIARCDNRGIAYQTLEMVRHLNPDRVLCVTMDDPAWPEDPSRFAGHDTTFISSNLSQNLRKRGLDEAKCRKWLDDLDVVLAVETVYDWRFIDWAADADVRVIVQGNPEFAAHHNNPDWSHPEWVWPTPWLIDELAAHGYGDTILPVPTVKREPTAADPDEGPLRVLHVVGKPAAGDRQGSGEFFQAIPSFRGPMHVTVVTQDRRLNRQVRLSHGVTLDIVTGGVDDRWDLYRDQHLVVLPRKYGGLCLPALEAMACGCAVVMPDCSPNDIWPGPRITGRKGPTQRSPFGKIQMTGVHPLDIASTVNRLNRDREALSDEMGEAAWWADLNSWGELGPRLYEPLLRGET